MKGDDPFPMFSLGNAEEIETAQPIENVTGQLSQKLNFLQKYFSQIPLPSTEVDMYRRQEQGQGMRCLKTKITIAMIMIIKVYLQRVEIVKLNPPMSRKLPQLLLKISFT